MKNIKYENRIKYNIKFEEGLKRFHLTKKELIKYNAYPFGGYVRDIYHNDEPTDLDLVFKQEKDLNAFLSYLIKEKNAKQIPHNSDPYSSRIVVKLTIENENIDLVLNHSFLSHLAYCDFFCNSYALDFSQQKFFLWYRPRNDEKSFYDLIFNYFDKKILIYNFLYNFDIKLPKFESKFKKNWKLHLGVIVENKIFKSNPFLDELKIWISNNYCYEKKEELIPLLLTSNSKLLRDYGKVFILNMEYVTDDIFLNLLLYYYSENRIFNNI